MLLFLPGLICDARVYAPQKAAFAQAHVVDGYGQADSLTAMARLALDQADALDADLIDLFGHSMGGRVAMEIVRLAPQRVRRLALVSTGIHPVGPGEAEARAQLQQVGYDHGFAALVDHWLAPMVAPANRTRPLYQDLRAMCLSKDQAIFDAQIKALLNRPKFDDQLAALECPVLVMTGELDDWSPPKQHLAIAERLRRPQLEIVPGAGHMITLEAPEAVNRAIAQWLATVPAACPSIH